MPQGLKGFKEILSVKIVVLYQKTKLSFFTNLKDKTLLLSKSFLVYNFKCPGCELSYIGETNRALRERLLELACDNNSVAI